MAAMEIILELTKNEQDIEGYVSAALSGETHTVTQQDQWGDSAVANDEQPCDTKPFTVLLCTAPPYHSQRTERRQCPLHDVSAWKDNFEMQTVCIC